MQNKEFITFLKRAVLLIALIILMDKLVGELLAYAFLKMKQGEPSRISYSINKADQDLIIFGSSKANHHYVPEVFEKELKLTTYNAGIDGQRILFDYAVLKSVLARKVPKLVVLDLHPNEFSNSEITYTGLNVLLPYYNSHPAIQDIINLRSSYEKYKALSSLYRYNSLIFTIAVNTMFSKEDGVRNGYYPFYNVWTGPLLDEIPEPEPEKTDSLKIRYFRMFLNEARAAGSRVAVMVSPVYRNTNGETVSMKIARQICEQDQILFGDYSQGPLFLEHPEYFQDPSHLNDEGARIYSGLVCEDIRAMTIIPASSTIDRKNILINIAAGKLNRSY